MGVVLPLGADLLNIIRSAKDSLFLAAPYIKITTLQKVVDEISSNSISLTCVTRWLPEDIAAGACDLEILDVIEGFPGGKLLVHPHLHAKYYRGDSRCLVGSANLTSRGLGWTTPANVELLLELPVDFDSLTQWETALLDAAIPATQELQENIRHEADRLLSNGALPHLPEIDQNNNAAAPASQWVPRCPTPEYLWDVYIGQGLDKMVTSAWEAAQKDLTVLSVPEGLTKNLFVSYITSIFKQMPIIAEIDGLASNGLSDSQAQMFLEDRLGEAAPYPIDRTWRVIKTWFTYFLQQTYRLEVEQEVLVKGQNISGLGKS
ncbi:MAG: phospholipase D family protein [Gemmatimonadetes bacterium]|nr:phospholipase D family protein [Gemmatimonadota bacterium]